MPPQDDQKKGPPTGFVLDQDRDYPEAAPAGTPRAVPTQPATTGWDTAKRALRFVADPAIRAAYSWATKDLPPPRLPPEEERPREAPAAAPTKPAKPAAAPRGDQGALEKTFDIAAQQSGHMLSEAQKEALRTAYGIATMHLPRSRAEFQAEYVEPFRRAARETPPGAGLGERMARGAAAGLIPSVGEAAGRGDISGAVGRAAGQLGAFGALGELGRGAPEGPAPAPAPAPATLPRTRGGLPPVPRVTTADMAGILEREMNRPAPSATEQLEAGAQGIFRKPYGQLTPEQQRVVARGLGGPPGGVERRTTVGEAPTAERRAGAMPLPTNRLCSVKACRLLAGQGEPLPLRRKPRLRRRLQPQGCLARCRGFRRRPLCQLARRQSPRRRSMRFSGKPRAKLNRASRNQGNHYGDNRA